MKYTIKLIAVIAIFVLSACGNSGQHDEGGVPDDSAEFYHDMATQAKENGKDLGECIEIQQKAVDCLRDGETSEVGVKVLSQMGHFLCRYGKYAEGLVYLQEASDSLKKSAPGNIDPLDATRLLGNTSNLYCRMGLYREALELNREALLICEGSGESEMSDLWRMRAVIFGYINIPDSVSYCNKRALMAAGEVSPKRQSERCRIFSENAYSWYIIEHPDYMPDEIEDAIVVLERNIDSGSQTVLTDSILIGRGYVLLGDYEKGLPMIEAGVERYRDYGDEELQWAMSILSESLLEKELSPKSLSIYKKAKSLTDTMKNRLRAESLLHADFRYRTAEIRDEKRLLEAKQQLTRERIILWGAVVLLVAGIVSWFAVRKIRGKNRLLQENKKSIDRLLNDRIELNRQIEGLNQLIGEKSADLSSDKEDTPELRMLQIALLTKEDEATFRQLFAVAFPGMIERLRRKYADITPSAELIVMLIRLNKSNDEIAFALGIKRDSVIKARYRLRSLFNLDKDMDLNQYIQQL